MPIAERFRDMRKKLGFKQADFGKLFNLSQDAISAIETGRNKPTVAILTQLYTAHNVDLGWLLTGEGTMFREKK